MGGRHRGPVLRGAKGMGADRERKGRREREMVRLEFGCDNWIGEWID